MSCSENCANIFAFVIGCCCIIPCLIGFVLIPIMVVYHDVMIVVNGAEWQNKSISNLSMLESVALSPFECPKVDVYFSHISPLFLEVKAPKNAAINLTLQDENTTDSQTIDICYAQANKTCSISIGGYDEIFAFVSFDPANNTEDGGVVQWSCSSLNVSLLVSILIIACCIGILCCLIACISFMVKRSCGSSNNNLPCKTYQELTLKSRKWKLTIPTKKGEIQPLLKNVKVTDCY